VGVARVRLFGRLSFDFVVVVVIIIIVSFMQGIHTRIPETNRVPWGYTVAAILSLLFMVIGIAKATERVM